MSKRVANIADTLLREFINIVENACFELWGASILRSAQVHCEKAGLDQRIEFPLSYFQNGLLFGSFTAVAQRVRPSPSRNRLPLPIYHTLSYHLKSRQTFLRKTDSDRISCTGIPNQRLDWTAVRPSQNVDTESKFAVTRITDHGESCSSYWHRIAGRCPPIVVSRFISVHFDRWDIANAGAVANSTPVVWDGNRFVTEGERKEWPSCSVADLQ
jgi:hypothetical protein